MAAVSPAALLHLELLPTSIAPLLTPAPGGDGSSVLAALAAALSKYWTARLFRDPSMDLFGAGLPLGCFGTRGALHAGRARGGRHEARRRRIS